MLHPRSTNGHHPHFYVGLTCVCEHPISGGGWYPPSRTTCTVGCTVVWALVNDPWWVSSGILPEMAFKRSRPKLLLAKRPNKARIFSKIKTKNKLHPQLRPRRSIYPFLFKNHLVYSQIYVLKLTCFSQTQMLGILSSVPLAMRWRSLVVELWKCIIRWKGEEKKST